MSSRRRCCLCFWLKGDDEVKKGQLAHLDGDHANSIEDNLAFLCLEHHDEYDGTPSVSKGLREREVRKWRNELYKEMEYRFRTSRRHAAEIKVVRFVRTFKSEEYSYYCVHFRLQNTGEAEIRSPTVSIALTDRGPFGEPRWEDLTDVILPTTRQISSDLFEQNGRIASISPAAVLLRDHSVDFFGLSLFHGSIFDGSIQDLKYRIDSEGMSPLSGTLSISIPAKVTDLVSFGYLEVEGLVNLK